MRKSITFIELIIVLCVIVFIVKGMTYKNPPKEIRSSVRKDSSKQIFIVGDMVLIKGCPTGDFFIGKYEVTNKEYYHYDPNHINSGNTLPADYVSWYDAVGYCKWLSQKTGKNYRLPTEEEWEYACRAGTDTKYYWGDEIDGSYFWYFHNSGNHPHPVGQKLPNAWGLYDMSGNLEEWCSDWYNKSKRCRVVRGGDAGGVGDFCQSGSRYSYPSEFGNSRVGFRLAMNP